MINHKLRKAREDKHWSIERAARETGLSKTSIIRWENGEQDPRGTSLEILCKTYGKSADDLGYPSSIQSDGSITLTAEEARYLTLLMGLGDTDMHHFDESKRQTIQRLIATASTAIIVPQLSTNAEPWERLATGRPTDIDAATLGHFQELTRSCWGLSNSSQLDIAEQVLSGFLPRLIQLAPHNPKAAGLASEGLQLQSILVAHRLKISDKVVLCQRAVALAEQSKDHNRLAAGLVQLGVAYRYAQKPKDALKTFQDALCYCDTISPLLQAWVYVEASEALSRFGRKREAEFYLNLGYEVFPDHSEQDPSFLFTDCGPFTLALYNGLTLLNMQHPSKAWDTFDVYLTNPLGQTAPERTRLEIVNHQGRAAILSGDLGKYTSCLEDGLAGAIALNSKKRFDEAYTIFQQDMPSAWLRETPIKQIVELYGLTPLNT